MISFWPPQLFINHRQECHSWSQKDTNCSHTDSLLDNTSNWIHPCPQSFVKCYFLVQCLVRRPWWSPCLWSKKLCSLPFSTPIPKRQTHKDAYHVALFGLIQKASAEQRPKSTGVHFTVGCWISGCEMTPWRDRCFETRQRQERKEPIITRCTDANENWEWKKPEANFQEPCRFFSMRKQWIFGGSTSRWTDL